MRRKYNQYIFLYDQKRVFLFVEKYCNASFQFCEKLIYVITVTFFLLSFQTRKLISKTFIVTTIFCRRKLDVVIIDCDVVIVVV